MGKHSPDPASTPHSALRTPHSLRVLVMGAGAMGSSVGGFLAKAGHRVTLVGFREHMDAIRKNGLHITGIWGEHRVTTLTPQTDLAGLKAGDFDLIIISEKSYDTAAAVRKIQHLVDDHTLVCAYQNGLGNAEQIAEVVGWHRTVGARIIYGVQLPEPGTVKITVIANPSALGVYTPDAPAEPVRDIAAAICAAGIPTEYTDRIATVLWGKIAYNCALNPLSGLLDVPYGVLAETQSTLDIMREVIFELYAVAAAMKVPLEPATPGAYMTLLVDKLIPPTAAHYASMRADFQSKRRTEIDALNGAICRYGQERGIPCPTNTMLTRLVRAREYALGIRY